MVFLAYTEGLVETNTNKKHFWWHSLYSIYNMYFLISSYLPLLSRVQERKSYVKRHLSFSFVVFSLDPICCSFLTWFGHIFCFPQSANHHNDMIFWIFVYCPSVTRVEWGIGQSANISIWEFIWGHYHVHLGVRFFKENPRLDF